MENNIAMYPTTFYRISLKAIIRNEKGEVLVNKEAGRGNWSLPGGGWDHDETKIECMKRELKEEIGYEGELTMTLLDVSEPIFMPKKQNWLVWLVYDVVLEKNTISVGEESDEVAFIDPDQYKDSSSLSERLVYTFSQFD